MIERGTWKEKSPKSSFSTWMISGMTHSIGWLTISRSEDTFCPSGYLSKYQMNKCAQRLLNVNMPIRWQEQTRPGMMPDHEKICLVEQREIDKLKRKPLQCSLSTMSTDSQILWEPFQFTGKHRGRHSKLGKSTHREKSECVLRPGYGWHRGYEGIRQAGGSSFISITGTKIVWQRATQRREWLF